MKNLNKNQLKEIMIYAIEVQNKKYIDTTETDLDYKNEAYIRFIISLHKTIYNTALYYLQDESNYFKNGKTLLSKNELYNYYFSVVK